MADLVPEIQPHNFLGWSKAAEQPKPDETWKNALEGLGHDIHGAVTTGVFNIEQQAQADIHSKVDAEQNKEITNLSATLENYKRNQSVSGVVQGEGESEGGGGGSNLPGTQLPGSLLNPPLPSMPEGLKRLPTSLEGIEAARAKGTLSQTAYDMRLWSILKDARAAYPGFRQYIDSEMHKATGKDVANASIQGLITDINSYITNANTEKNKLISAVHGDRELEGSPIAMQNVTSGKWGWNEYMAWSAPQKAEKHRLEMAEIKLKTKSAVNTDMAKDIEYEFTRHGAVEVQNSMDRLELFSGTTYGQVARGEKTIPEDQARQAGESIRQYAETIRKRLIDHALQQKVPNDPSGRNWYTMMDASKVNSTLDQLIAPVKHQADLVSDGKWTMAERSKHDNEQIKDMDHNKFMRDPVMGPIARMAVVTKDMGPLTEGMTKWINSQNLEEGIKTYVSAAFRGAVDQPGLNGTPGGNGVPASPPTGIPITFFQTLQTAQKSGIADAKTAQSLMHIVSGITNPNSNDVEKKNLATFAFDPQNLKLLSTDIIKSGGVDPNNPDRKIPGKWSVFGGMTSDPIAKEMNRLGGDHLQNYNNFVERGFGYVFRQSLGELDKLQENPNVRLSFENNQWKVNFTTRALSPSESTTQYQPESIPVRARKDIENVIDDINTGLRSIKRVYETQGRDKNEATNEYLFRTMREAGFTPTIGNVRGIPDKMLEALKQAHAGEALERARKEELFKTEGK